MGVGKSQFSEEELQDYQDLTYFTKKEVLHAHQKFKALAPEKVGHNRNAKLPMSKILQYPELRANPFGDRICKVFSSSQDGDCTFEDFLDMMSVFSDAAPKAVKAEHAFRIFDFDGDDMLGIGDLRQVVDRLTALQRLNETDMQQVLQYILDEADLDDDGALSFAEFEHIIEKSSDFSNERSGIFLDGVWNNFGSLSLSYTMDVSISIGSPGKFVPIFKEFDRHERPERFWKDGIFKLRERWKKVVEQNGTCITQ